MLFNLKFFLQKKLFSLIVCGYANPTHTQPPQFFQAPGKILNWYFDF